MLKDRTVLLAALLLPGCLSNVVALQPEAKTVQIVHETDKPIRCEVLGKISGTSRSSDEKEARTGAENDFRNNAAALKANFALVEADRNNQVGTGNQRDIYLGGKALRCETEETEAAEEKAQAAEREQKDKEEAEAKAKEEEEKQAAKSKK